MPLTTASIADRSATIGVIGLGYVGLPLALTLAEAGFPVLGFDTDPAKLPQLAAGRSYLRHIPDARIAAAQTFRATGDFSRIAACQAVLICVPTPLDAHVQPDLRFVEATARTIAPHLAAGTLVVLESTTWPGTTIELVQPLLEAGSGFRLGAGLLLAFSPEREDPGNQRFSTKTIPKLVGGADVASSELAVALYQAAIDHVIPVSDTRVAEMAKLFENIFRSVNIALVNEIKVILDRMGIDVHDVIKAAATKPFGFMPFWPGPGLGGHCIPLDPFYFSWKAKEFGVEARFIELAGEINRAMPAWVVGKVQDCLNDHGKPLKGSRILLLGLAYKADVDDVRESPALVLIKLLEAKGARVDYHDPHIPVLQATRDHGDIAGRTSCALAPCYDCFVVVTAHSSFAPQVILSHGVPVVDTRRILPPGPLVYPA
jgi:UDP-N-acetyl-D-glucosamine dehydrogenase